MAEQKYQNQQAYVQDTKAGGRNAPPIADGWYLQINVPGSYYVALRDLKEYPHAGSVVKPDVLPVRVVNGQSSSKLENIVSTEQLGKIFGGKFGKVQTIKK
jgi:hypothetical protein